VPQTTRSGGPLFSQSWTLSPSHIRSANFLPVGATTANLYVKDKHGKFRDVLLGYDNHVGDVPCMFLYVTHA
jgi:hypothetical protein